MVTLLVQTTRSLVHPCRSGTPLLQLAGATAQRVTKVVMWRCHQVEVVSVTNGRSDWRRYMTALLEVALPLKRRRVVHSARAVPSRCS